MNPVSLVTGASRGIGRGVALELARLGHDLVINYVSNERAAEATAAECRSVARSAGREIRALTCQADVSQGGDRERLVRFVRASFRRLDLLVNNAGVAPQTRADILEGTEESFDRLIAINVKGPYFLSQLVARWMIEQAETEAAPDATANPGAVPHQAPGEVRNFAMVTITSISAYTASVNRGDYCVSKAALSMLTPLFASRLAGFGIRVYEIRPGIIETDMTGPVHEKYDRLIREGLTPIRRWGQPADVGRAVAAIASGALPFSTGEVINVDGGFHLRQL